MQHAPRGRTPWHRAKSRTFDSCRPLVTFSRFTVGDCDLRSPTRTTLQWLVVSVFRGARVDTRSVGRCGIAGYHRRGDHRTDQEGEDGEERAHLVKEWNFERRKRGKKAQKSLTPRTSD